MFYYTYKITNLINEKIYIGVHKTENLEDGYMGSGKLLNRAKAKHGIENFHKEILKFHESQEEMYAHEAELVTQDFLARDDVYNIKLGGEGGWDFINSTMSKETRIKMAKNGAQGLRNRLSTDGEYAKLHASRSGARWKTDWTVQSKREKMLRNIDWNGKTHSEESKAKARDSFAKINHQQGEKNSQFGKMWIHSLEERKSKRINNNEPIPTGWIKGRKMFKD